MNLAYLMQAAYTTQKTRPEAVAVVLVLSPGADEKCLRAMWDAIDAYADMKGKEPNG